MCVCVYALDGSPPQGTFLQTATCKNQLLLLSHLSFLDLARPSSLCGYAHVSLQVWLGVWRGIPVAVKIMHLATSLLVDPHQGDYQQNDPDQQGQITPPHFAVMEAVLSSQCSHPNVVTVYTYMLSPLLTAVHNSGSSEPRADGSSTTAACQLEGRVPTIVGEPGHGSSAAEVAAAAAAAAANCAASCNATLSGWELQLVQELCDEVGEVWCVQRQHAI